MKRIIVPFVTIAIVSVIAVSCSTSRPIRIEPRPIRTESAQNNDTYNVSFLFEHDGCKVYRFTDNFRYVYFTNCTGNTSTAQNDSTDVQIQVFTNIK